MSITIAVYNSAGSLIVSDVPARQSPNWVDTYNDTGSGSVLIHKLDATLVANPSIINYDNIIRCKIDGVDRFAFVIEARGRPPASENELAGDYWTLSGRGVLALLEDAIVYPDAGLVSPWNVRDRSFGWMSQAYDDSAWTNAVQIQRQDSTYLPAVPVDAWVRYPGKWPDPNAYWIWSRAMDGSNKAPAGYSYFRKTFTTGGSDVDVMVYATADDSFALWIDDVLILQAKDYGKTYKARVTLKASSTHTIAMRGRNRVYTAAGVLFSVAELDDTGHLTGTFLTRSTSSTKCLDYPASVPGMTCGQIIRQLIAEAQARSGSLLAGITTGFTNSLDTKSAAWTNKPALSFPVGTSYMDVIRTLVEQYIDVEMTPALVLNAYNKDTLGTDRSGTVSLLVGQDWEALDGQGESHVTNVILARALNDQLDESVLSTSHKRRETYVEAATAPTDTTDLATALASDYYPHRTARMTGRVRKNSGILTTWNRGDRITIPSFTGTAVTTVGSVAVEEDDAGNELLTVEGLLYDE